MPFLLFCLHVADTLITIGAQNNCRFTISPPITPLIKTHVQIFSHDPHVLRLYPFAVLKYLCFFVLPQFVLLQEEVEDDTSTVTSSRSAEVAPGGSHRKRHDKKKRR